MTWPLSSAKAVPPAGRTTPASASSPTTRGMRMRNGPPCGTLSRPPARYAAGVPEERLNVYDAGGAVVAVRRRRAARGSGLPVGAVNALVIGPRGRVLLQRRRTGHENGGRWDKTVGGHVSAGESFDECVRREAGEELFGDGASPRVRLVRSEAALRQALA